MTQDQLRKFVYGIMTGIAIMVGSFVAVCEITGVRFQPIIVSR